MKVLTVPILSQLPLPDFSKRFRDRLLGGVRGLGRGREADTCVGRSTPGREFSARRRAWNHLGRVEKRELED